MSKNSTSSRLMKASYHFISLFIALLVLTGVFTYQYKTHDKVTDFTDKLEAELKEFQPKYHTINYSKGYGAELLVTSSLSDTNKIVIFGSSELSGIDHDLQVPYFFLNRPAFKKQAFAIGHAGNQSLAILTQLMTCHKPIDESNLVFFVSPGWFSSSYADGTALASFLEFAPNRNLLRILFNEHNEEVYINRIKKYLAEHKQDLSGSSQMLSLFNDYGDDLWGPLKWKNDFFWELNKAHHQDLLDFDDKVLTSILKKLPEYSFEKALPVHLNWDSLAAVGEAYQASRCTNNNYGIYDEYFTKYVEGKELHIYPSSIEGNTELSDFKLLVDYLVSRKNKKALFIILPLHAQVYKGIENLSPVVADVDAYIRSKGFAVYNMWNTEPEKYRVGTLTDVMHIGETGWTIMNEQIVKQFNDEQ